MSRSEHSTITYVNDLPIKVNFTFVEGRPQTYWEPEEPAEVEIEELLVAVPCRVGGKDHIYDLAGAFTEEIMERIEQECFNHVYALQEQRYE